MRYISTLALTVSILFANAALAVGYTDGHFPDESSTTGLPEVIPCVFEETSIGRELKCVWMGQDRILTAVDGGTGEEVRYSNYVRGKCEEGVCRFLGNIAIGNYDEDVPFTLSQWYYIGQSVEGWPVAYLYQTGPIFGGEAVEYRTAGKHLHAFYQLAGVSEKDIRKLMHQRYAGGWYQYTYDNELVVVK